jgi:hypothetical protein
MAPYSKRMQRTGQSVTHFPQRKMRRRERAISLFAAPRVARQRAPLNCGAMR